ncbi:hypothetical protein [Sedimenticola sp.]|uniref:hypothetical protein n=1 Tax=Sedimenticola sp. TaxID=1940285 RepID=UPI003D10CF6F
MKTLVNRPDLLAEICAATDAEQDIAALEQTLQRLVPEAGLRHVLTRGNWHRPGGVVDADFNPVSSNIRRWAEQESAGDVDALIANYADAGYFATQLSGKTHYFTFACGSGPADFIQLEIEQLQEVVDRQLVAADWYPDSLEEFLDPLDSPRLSPVPVAQPFYRFRRITPIARLLDDTNGDSRAFVALRRFLQDWRDSSAAEGTHFCHHWILALREYMDRDGEVRLTASPVTTFRGTLPDLPPGETLVGAELANAIHAYDRVVGYPFAWFFHMLSRQAENYQLAKAVLRDLMGAYDYLPARDLKVLRQWEAQSYAV